MKMNIRIYYKKENIIHNIVFKRSSVENLFFKRALKDTNYEILNVLKNSIMSILLLAQFHFMVETITTNPTANLTTAIKRDAPIDNVTIEVNVEITVDVFVHTFGYGKKTVGDLVLEITSRLQITLCRVMVVTVLVFGVGGSSCKRGSFTCWAIRGINGFSVIACNSDNFDSFGSY
ncbi:hypothetical protein Glove_13g173 [Diversispora epigaea]|uniref:Uncharacterized protein n=1 Tax=Diversispora epigaea TaxID=1348612 RepID=A0A397JPQ6_9GLOM|nr:hypothetical protein Glove_13g173 [Diversispora epigaea]